LTRKGGTFFKCVEVLSLEKIEETAFIRGLSISAIFEKPSELFAVVPTHSPQQRQFHRF
tara:strand:- start:1246 stop:1422 length:177 start_codon:yes stop_codon:yes gene_type:complete